MMQNRNPTAAVAAQAPVSNGAVLASLPPAVPSVGFVEGAPDPAKPNPNDSSSMGAAAESIPNNNDVPHSIKLGNRLILTSHAPRRWAWTSFSSSARRDGVRFHHWVRASVEYADYPYARFDVSLDLLDYTNEEYKNFLEMDVGGVGDLTVERTEKKEKRDEVKDEKGGSSSSNVEQPSLQKLLSASDKVCPWTKAETDTLMELVRACDLRWPVIIDRWHTRFRNSPTSRLRKVEDLQHRYYSVGSMLVQRRAEAVMAREAAKIAGGRGAEDVAGGGAGAVAATAPSTTISGPTVAAHDPSLSVANVGKDSNADGPVSTVVSNSKLAAPASTHEAEALKTTQQLASLHPSLAPPLSLPGTGTAHRGAKAFDLAAERARRAHLDWIWKRPKAEERKEDALRAELRAVEGQLRRLKKGGKHLAPAGSALAAPPPAQGLLKGTGDGEGGAVGSTGGDGYHGTRPGAVIGRGAPVAPAPSVRLHPLLPPPPTLFPPRPAPDPFLYTRQDVAASFADTAPVPSPGTPYLQSGRLFPPSVEGHAGLNKATLKQMRAMLAELRVPSDPIPTRRSCDLYDGVRKEALTLLILQKMALRKEAELKTKRVNLEAIRAAAEGGVAENAKDAKEEGSGKGGVGKGKKVKAKRPRADSVGSAREGSAVKKGAGGPKKKPRRKPAVAAIAAASSAAPTAPPPPAAADATPAMTAPPGPTCSYGSMPPPATILSDPGAMEGAAHHPHPKSMTSLPPSACPTGANVAAAAAAHPGTAAKKAGKKARGRKKPPQS